MEWISKWPPDAAWHVDLAGESCNQAAGGQVTKKVLPHLGNVLQWAQKSYQEMEGRWWEWTWVKFQDFAHPHQQCEVGPGAEEEPEVEVEEQLIHHIWLLVGDQLDESVDWSKGTSWPFLFSGRKKGQLVLLDPEIHVQWWHFLRQVIIVDFWWCFITKVWSVHHIIIIMFINWVCYRGGFQKRGNFMCSGDTF